MKRFALLTVGVLALLTAATVGCEDPKLAALQQQYNELKAKYDDAQTKNKNLQGDLAGLTSQLEKKEMELAAAKRELDGLKARGGTVVAPRAGGGAVTHGNLGEDWQETATGAKATVGSDILFAVGKADLSPAGQAKIKEIAATIEKNFPGDLVRVYGYTDGDPIHKTANLWQDNLDLSSNRAMAVTRALAKNGIKADKIETIGMGETHPLAPNTTAAGKAKNRRVEIVVVK